MVNNYKVIIVDNGKEEVISQIDSIPNLSIHTVPNAKRNIIKIWKAFKFGKNSEIFIRGIDSVIELKSTSLGENFYLLTGINCHNQKIVIGENVTVWKDLEIHVTDNDNCVTIGNDCMFSKNTKLWTSDGHAIIDLETNSVINCVYGDITIEEHVWIGSDVAIQKGVKIGCNSIIGSGAVVTKSFPQNVIVAGVPAKIIKENVTWSRYSPSRYIEKFLS